MGWINIHFPHCIWDFLIPLACIRIRCAIADFDDLLERFFHRQADYPYFVKFLPVDNICLSLKKNRKPGIGKMKMSRDFDLQLVILRLENCHPQRIQAARFTPFLSFLAAHDFSSFLFHILGFMCLSTTLVPTLSYLYKVYLIITHK